MEGELGRGGRLEEIPSRPRLSEKKSGNETERSRNVEKRSYLIRNSEKEIAA